MRVPMSVSCGGSPDRTHVRADRLRFASGAPPRPTGKEDLIGYLASYVNQSSLMPGPQRRLPTL